MTETSDLEDQVEPRTLVESFVNEMHIWLRRPQMPSRFINLHVFEVIGDDALCFRDWL